MTASDHMQKLAREVALCIRPGQRWFHLTVPESTLRTLKRAEYYALRTWLRACERKIELEINRRYL